MPKSDMHLNAEMSDGSGVTCGRRTKASESDSVTYGFIGMFEMGLECRSFIL